MERQEWTVSPARGTARSGKAGKVRLVAYGIGTKRFGRKVEASHRLELLECIGIERQDRLGQDRLEGRGLFRQEGIGL